MGYYKVELVLFNTVSKPNFKTKRFVPVPVRKKRKNDVWLKMLLGTCLLESLKANTKDGTEKNEKRTKETMNFEYLV